MTSGLFAAVDQGAQRAYEVPVLTEHDRPGLRARHRLGLGQELVAGGNEGGDLGAGVAVAGTGYIGVDGATWRANAARTVSALALGGTPSRVVASMTL